MISGLAEIPASYGHLLLYGLRNTLILTAVSFAIGF